MGTFYSIIGIILGLNNIINAGYLGFGLHVVIGTLIGTVLGNRNQMEENTPAYSIKKFIARNGAGIVIWLILFLPITSLLIQPSVQHIVVILAIAWQKTILADQLSHSIANIALDCNCIPSRMGSNIWLCDELITKNQSV